MGTHIGYVGQLIPRRGGGGRVASTWVSGNKITWGHKVRAIPFSWEGGEGCKFIRVENKGEG